MWGVEARPPSTARRAVASIGVDNRSDIRDFLASRRARITPEQAGLLPGRRSATGPRAAPRGGRRPRRGEHRLVHPAGEGPHRRRLRGRPRGRRPGAAAGRGRADLPVRPGPRRHQAGPHAPAPRQGADPAARAVDAGLDDRRRRRSSRTAAWTSSRPTPWGGRCTHRCSTPRGGRRTSPGSSSSTRGRATSTRTGRARPTSPSPCSAPRPAATRTTRSCASSSGSCPRSARSSAPAGPRTTSASTTTAPSSSATPSSALSTSATTPSTCPPRTTAACA